MHDYIDHDGCIKGNTCCFCSHKSYSNMCDSNNNEVTSFHSTQSDEVLEIYARLYIDGEWKAWRDLDFDVYDPQGKKIIHCERLTSMISGYTGIGIWSNDLHTWKPGDYTIKVSYEGNEANGWPAASKTAVIHHTK
jgi:hypothetical protein